MTFDAWMTIVNERISSVLGGMDSDDIPDWGYWDAWNDGVNPNEAACEALKEAGMTDADEYFSA